MASSWQAVNHLINSSFLFIYIYIYIYIYTHIQNVTHLHYSVPLEIMIAVHDMNTAVYMEWFCETEQSVVRCYW